ncbi:hypothetical protein CONPUDRAFT_159833 [Coniophora puteana RWD-64-598 SS2]|uniref:Uncharacterized protein n=1 Tax=Coniophora puteana (strain RWD-64-598) TaxID=741705 RepID=R7SHJ2_CONPW|nr:uncharacterized protein CONPUDRAFT_159833 [Coniophora puteana RWD-64-598 SS2]EIW74539.1 hypothetical protein CONPUDRAFT_159833 [Coniophora puteana RWD-64-598 SS2]
MPAHGDQRYSKTLLKKAATGTRKPTCRRFAVSHVTKTPNERAALKLERLTRRHELNAELKAAQLEVMERARQMHQKYRRHSVGWYFEAILQQARADGKKRDLNPWNAFLHVKTRELNDALPPDAKRLTASERSAELKALWAEIPLEERAEFTKEMVDELEKHRQNKEDTVHNFSLQAFHDAQSTLVACADQLNRMAGRTDTRVMLMAVRSDNEHVLTPYFYASDVSLPTYFHALTRYTPQEFLSKLESCTISGLIGLIHNSRDEYVLLKKQVALLILTKLRKAANFQFTRMEYVHFDTAVTEKFGVVVVNWPFKTFACLSSYSSIPELKVLLSAWETGTTSFHKLSPQEWKEWLAEQTRKRMEEANGMTTSQPESSLSESSSPEPSLTEPSPAASSPATSSSSSPAAPSPPALLQPSVFSQSAPPQAAAMQSTRPSPARLSASSLSSSSPAVETNVQFIMSGPDGKAIKQPRVKAPRKPRKKATASATTPEASPAGQPGYSPANTFGVAANIGQVASPVDQQVFNLVPAFGGEQNIGYGSAMLPGQQSFGQYLSPAGEQGVGLQFLSNNQQTYDFMDTGFESSHMQLYTIPNDNTSETISLDQSSPFTHSL